MNDIETLEEFYKKKISNASGATQKSIGDFNAFVLEDVVNPEGEVTIKYARRDFYKISLITGSNLFHYADKTIKIDGTCLISLIPKRHINGNLSPKTILVFSAFLKMHFIPKSYEEI